MNLKFELSPANLKHLEIKQITLDKEKFGALVFEKAYPILHDLRKQLVELQEFGYTTKLAPDEVRDVDGYISKLIQYLTRINSIDPAKDPNFNVNTRNALENEIEHFCNDTKKRIRNHLVFLRQEAALKTTDQQTLAESQKAAAQAEREYISAKKALEKELLELRTRRVEVEEKQGELVAVGLGKDFGGQAEVYEIESKKWLWQRNLWFYILFFIVMVNILLYIVLFVKYKIDPQSHLNPKDFFTLQYAIAKITLLVLLSYAVGFCSRNFNINSGLAKTNRHRKNVAEVLNHALSTNMTESAKGEITREAATAMFKHLPVGYINREHQNDGGPIWGIVNKVSPVGKD